MARNRVIYQSQALFIAPSATGAQISGVQAGGTGPITAAPFGPQDSGSLGSGISLLKKMDRIQSCNFNFTINRQDVNEFGKLARIDSIINEPPTVGLDFSYYVTDGFNERLLGFNVTGVVDGQGPGGTSIDTNTAVNAQSISGLLSDLQGNNYYILTVDEGEDVVGGTVLGGTSNVVSIGNGFITDYSFEASVGGLPTASVTVEAFNIKTDTFATTVSTDADAIGGTAVNKVLNSFVSGDSPAVNLFNTPAEKFTAIGKAYKLDQSRQFEGTMRTAEGVNFTGFTTGESLISALRPGDITLSFPEGDGFVAISGSNQAHIQSFNFSIPLSRTVLQRLGSVFGYTRVVDVPINFDLSISAVVSELREANLFDIMAQNTKNNFTLTLNDSNATTPKPKMQYTIKGAILQSETYSESIGDNQSVDLVYTVQVGGANDTTNGVFMSGNYKDQLDSITSGFFKLGTAKLD
jgi:hypothetical protein